MIQIHLDMAFKLFMNKKRYNRLIQFFVKIYQYIQIYMSCITITFGDQAQNHEGMQIIGKQADNGFSRAMLEDAKIKFEGQGYKCQLINLNQYIEEQADDACVLVVKKEGKNGRDLMQQLTNLEWDSKVYMYGKVVNKHARHNLCFADEQQDPNYQEKKGRIIPWKNVPILCNLKKNIQGYIEQAEELAAQGNYYFNTEKCGVGFHGDRERKKVIAIRLCNGKCPPLHYQWFYKSKPVGKRAIIQLQDRDLYIMSQKAVGTDWLKKNRYTLRHATGCQKFLKI